MKKILLTIALLASFCCNATLITLDLDKATYDEGELITAQLAVDDIDYFMGGFAAEIGFDSSTIELVSWMFGDGFDDGFGSYSYADDVVAGLLYLEDFADLSADQAILESNQGSGFTLATFTFRALAAGPQVLSILSGMEVISMDNNTLDTFGQVDAQFSVNPVPEPATAILILSSLLILGRRNINH